MLMINPRSVPSILCSLRICSEYKALFSTYTFPVNRIVMKYHRFAVSCNHMRYQRASNYIQLFCTFLLGNLESVVGLWCMTFLQRLVLISPAALLADGMTFYPMILLGIPLYNPTSPHMQRIFISSFKSSIQKESL